jgi:hypothetical protein
MPKQYTVMSFSKSHKRLPARHSEAEEGFVAYAPRKINILTMPKKKTIATLNFLKVK